MDSETSTSYDVLERMLLDESAEPTSLPLSLLQYITNHFSLDNEIGRGGFAVVYKGMVGKGMVAVKKLSNTFGLHENKFHEEVKCLINAKHKNIVRFLGYCAETQGKMQKFEGKFVMADQRNWLLCFEYVCKGSLDKHITDATCGLNWRERYQIIKGITEGLLFLHEMRILHLDLKPANILLDSQMVPKIADFGLSRCLGEDQTRAITENLSGTQGYMDPEYLKSRQIAFASDIYSLGVIIMEILTGTKQYLDDDYVVESWMNRLDASERHMQLEQVRVCSKIGIECMNLDPKKRPVARHIIVRLDKTTSADYSETSTSYDVLERMLLDESAEPTSLPLSLLQYVTNHFSLDNQIGSGGFAVVYKGMVGKGMVAVKKLSNTFGLHENKFHEEVKCLINAKHKNIVRFLGYCAETQGIMQKFEGKLVMADQRNWLLCFEYVCNGSLDKHITDATCGLNWRERYRIIKGITEGLLFLHEMRILHLDLKPANILLDSHMVPKIADFGLSRCLGEDQTRAITENLRGTLGYMDPEYLRSRQIAFASDIYSLGVIIMEILTGAKRYLDDDYVVESWMNRLDASERHMQLEQVRVCSKIGIECMSLDPKKRPVARHIIDRLDKTTSADYSEDCTREQFGERIGKLGAESLQKADVKEHSEIFEDVAERLEWLHMQECQLKVGQLPLWGVQDMKEKVNHHGASNSSSIFTGFSEKNILDIFNKKAHSNIDRSDRRMSHFINIFRKEELWPIVMSSNQIRKGGFTEVYKGVVGDALVAVKTLISGNVLGIDLLENEVIIQSQIVHKNIAWLIGCCLETENPMLVYEFLPRGSLHDILHGGSKVPLNLDVRLNIIAESAQGLAYLHSQAHTKIVHGYIKPASILLDENFVPKISDFFMSRLIVRDNEHTVSVMGDMNYMDPVHLQTGVLTEKSDVYSFGIVILEIISRKKAIHSESNSLVKSFLEVHEKGKKATELFDKEIAVTGNLELLCYLAEIAVECLNIDVDQRPSMTDVAERLVILNRFRRLYAEHISGDYSDETDISSSFVEQKKEFLGVQDMNHPGANISSSMSAGLNKLSNLDIFNRKAHKNFERNSRVLDKSNFMKIFRKKEIRPILRMENIIAKGGFTEIYQGSIDNEVVVVKKPINGSVLENKQIENQVIILSQVSHKNIVRLIGFCLEVETPVLVYELISKGSIDNVLHSSNSVPLDLDVRLTIIAESAQGLAYLHSQARIKIRHGNVKPVNILLDEKFMPKIAGFGISRLIARDDEHTCNVIGDLSYIDPIYLQTGLLTEKSDVYSFGIVILEVISRKKATYSDDDNLVNSFLDVHRKGKKTTELFDKEIALAGNLEILDYLAEIAVQCLNLDVDQRPTMTYVAERLLTVQRYHRSKLFSNELMHTVV